MEKIRPVSDLRNHFATISKEVYETGEPVFLTQNGYGDMVVMSYEAYQKFRFDSEVYFQLKEAELEAEQTAQRFSHKEVFADLKKMIQAKAENSEL